MNLQFKSYARPSLQAELLEHSRISVNSQFDLGGFSSIMKFQLPPMFPPHRITLVHPWGPFTTVGMSLFRKNSLNHTGRLREGHAFNVHETDTAHKDAHGHEQGARRKIATDLRMPKEQPVGTHEASPKPRDLKAARSQETMRRGCLAPSASAHRRATRAQCVSLGQGSMLRLSMPDQRPPPMGLSPSARRSR